MSLSQNTVVRSLTAGDESPDWRQLGLCSGQDADLFHPVSHKGPELLRIAEAKAVCRRCPSRKPCLDWAVGTGATGVWGATTEEGRRSIRRRMNPQSDEIAGRTVPAAPSRDDVLRLHKAGLAPGEIALRLGARRGQVVQWIEDASRVEVAA